MVVGDGRRQWGTVQGARDQSHLTDGLANTCTFMHLGRGVVRLGDPLRKIHVETPFKKVLGVPDLMMLDLTLPAANP